MTDPTTFINPDIWAQTGGLIGLVIAALFGSLAIFIWTQVKIYEMHRADQRETLELHAKEREKWGVMINSTQKETAAAIRAMAAALNEMASRYRRTD